MGTWWLDVGTAGVVRCGSMRAGAAGSVAVPRCGHQVPRDVGTSGAKCLDVDTRCLDVGTA